MTRKQFAGYCSVLTHAIAILCAVAGLGIIVAAPLDSAIYGIALIVGAIALDVIVATQCHPNTRSRSRSRRVTRSRGVTGAYGGGGRSLVQ